MNITIIGVGRMGHALAKRLLELDRQVAVYDLRPEAGRDLAQMGARVCRDLAELCSLGGTVITSLPGPGPVEAVYLHPSGLATELKNADLVIDTSTITPQLAVKLHDTLADRNIPFVESPLSGGVGAAASGRLTAMVGASAAGFAHASSVLRDFCSTISHVGPPGSGSVTKLINQAIYLSYVSLFCEHFNVARKFGLDLAALQAVLRNSLAGNPLRTRWDDRLLTHDAPPQFPINDALRDLRMAKSAWLANGLQAPVFFKALETFESAASSGRQTEDMTALYEMLSESA